QNKRLELRDLERAIAKLPEEQRSVLLLVGLEGMRYEEVATVLDVPVGTIRSRLSRGREMLRQLMGIGESSDEEEGAKVMPLRRFASHRSPTMAAPLGGAAAEPHLRLAASKGGI